MSKANKTKRYNKMVEKFKNFLSNYENRLNSKEPQAGDDFVSNRKKFYDSIKTKYPRSASEFIQPSYKDDGVNKGYIAKSGNDTQAHMIKSADPREYHHTIGEYNDSDVRMERFQQRDFIAEFATAGVYKRILPNRTPDIQLVKSNDKDSNHPEEENLALSSRYIDDFKTMNNFLDEYIVSKYPLLGPEGEKYEKQYGHFPVDQETASRIMQEAETEAMQMVDGMEKLIAGAFLAGEQDMHYGNLGVVNEQLEHGEKQKSTPNYKAVKIDHGRSFGDIAKRVKRDDNLSDILEDTTDIPLNLDSSKLAEAFEEISNLKQEELESFMDARKHELRDELKSMGYIDENDRALDAFKDNQNSKSKSDNSEHSLLREMEQHKHRLSDNLEIFKQFNQNIQIASKVVDSINTSNKEVIDNPLRYAKKNNLKISVYTPNEYEKLKGIKTKDLNIKQNIKERENLKKGIFEKRKKNKKQKLPDPAIYSNKPLDKEETLVSNKNSFQTELIETKKKLNPIETINEKGPNLEAYLEEQNQKHSDTKDPLSKSNSAKQEKKTQKKHSSPKNNFTENKQAETKETEIADSANKTTQNESKYRKEKPLKQEVTSYEEFLKEKRKNLNPVEINKGRRL